MTTTKPPVRMPSPHDLGDALRLATLALPMHEEEWGSDRQSEAVNEFFAFYESFFGDINEHDEDFASWLLKATTEEMVAAALARLCHWAVSRAPYLT